MALNMLGGIIVIGVVILQVIYEINLVGVARKNTYMKTVLIAGGTGLVGSRLQTVLRENGFSVIVLSRKKTGQSNGVEGVRFAQWDSDKGTIDEWAIKEADYIINLSGAGVAEKRWTTERKKEILLSRVKSGQTLVNALVQIPNKVEAVVNSSAIGWYGPDPSIPNPHPFVETDPHYSDFLGETCLQWEQSIEPVSALGKRLVLLRTGIVLSNKGGALAEFKKPLQFGVAASLGSGKQVVSWIHIDDLCGLFLKAITDNHMRGAYNAVAPIPVSNLVLTHTLAKTINKFWVPAKVPAFVLKIVLGEMSIEVLKSATISASKAIEAGFEFKYPDIQSALSHLKNNPRS